MRRLPTALAVVALAAGCQRTPVRAPATAPAPGGSVLADTALGGALPPASVAPAEPPPAVLAVSPSRSGPGIPPPEPAPDEPPAPAGAVDRLPVDDRLRPPLPLGATHLRLPGGVHGSVELELRVDERGVVTDATVATRGADPALARAAVDAARALRYQPARRGGTPVAVWCRQRFDAGR